MAASRPAISVSAGIAPAAVIALILSSPLTAFGYEYGYTVGLGFEYSDNIRRIPEEQNPQSEFTRLAVLGFFFNERSRELDAQVNGTVTYRSFRDSAFANDTTYGLNGNLLWKPAPELFHWWVADVYTQAVINPREATTPENLADQNVFSTGPDVFLRFGPLNQLNLGGRYTRTTFSDTANAATGADDSSGVGGYVRWLYRATSYVTLSLNYEAETVDYDEPGLPADFDRQDGFVRFDAQYARDNVVVDVGKTRTQRESEPQAEADLRRFTWSRTISSDSSLQLAYSDTVGDEVRAALELLGPTPPTQLVARTEFFRRKQSEARFTRALGAGTMTLRGFDTTTRYEREPVRVDDEDVAGGELTLAYPLTGSLTGTLGARYAKTEFPNVDRVDRQQLYQAALIYRLGLRWSLQLRGQRIDQSSTDPLQVFVENLIGLDLAYNTRFTGTR